MGEKRIIGVIGCGTIVKEQYVHVLRQWPEVLLFDLVEKNARDVAEIVKATVSKTMQRIVNEADVIIIATPLSTHYELLKQVLQNGKTVIVEKPFLPDKNSAEEILKLAAERGADLKVAHLRRIFPATAMAKQLVNTGILGGLQSVDIFEGVHFRYQSLSNYIINDPLGGVLPDMGCHSLDQALFISGMDEAKAFSADVIYAEKDKAEPSHIFRAQFKLNDIPFKINLSRRGALANKINFVFEKGTLEVPAGLLPKIALTSAKGRTVFKTGYSINNYAEAFLLQYKQIFNVDTAGLFSASRFINLTETIEKLLQHTNKNNL